MEELAKNKLEKEKSNHRKKTYFIRKKLLCNLIILLTLIHPIHNLQWNLKLNKNFNQIFIKLILKTSI